MWAFGVAQSVINLSMDGRTKLYKVQYSFVHITSENIIIQSITYRSTRPASAQQRGLPRKTRRGSFAHTAMLLDAVRPCPLVSLEVRLLCSLFARLPRRGGVRASPLRARWRWGRRRYEVSLDRCLRRTRQGSDTLQCSRS